MTWTQTDSDRVAYPHHGVSRARGHQHWCPKRPLYSSFLSDALENRIDDLIRRALPSHIRRQIRTLPQHSVDSSLDLIRRCSVSKVAQHERSGTNGRDRVCPSKTLDVRRRTVHRLAHHEVATCIHRGDESERADEGRRCVGQDVTVEVRCDENVVDLGLAE